ncbi:hypothetical protein HYU22_05395 [Candidatus Woesearchaeota archaeon]|nr:hypothetical protein [Candidatus Woesearchaeota archaeon]
MPVLTALIDQEFLRKMPGLARELRHLEAEARRKEPSYIEESREVVRADRWRKWRSYVHRCTGDALSADALEASLRVMKGLSAGNAPEQALESINGMEITYYMAGSMAEAVSYFHPRGEEFKAYCTEKYPALKLGD